MTIGNKTSFKNNPIAKQGETVTRRRYTDVNDGMGGMTSQTYVDLEIKVVFGNITAKDLKIHEMGLAVPGNLKVYFDVDQDLIEGDSIIRSDSIEWHMDKITAQYPDVYSIGIVRNISLTGSE